MSENTRLRWVTWIVVAACIAGMALCHRLWLADRSFPLIPVFGSPRAPAAVNGLLLAAFLCMLVGSGVWTSGCVLKFGAGILAVALIALDQSRLQPWFYQYVLMLVILACRRPASIPDDRTTLATLRLLVIFLYAFSAAHKFSHSFFFDTGPLLLRPLAGLVPDGWSVVWLAFPMPLVELTLAGLLLHSRTRRAGVVLAAAMHAAILLLIGPLGIGYNTVVWPWNVAMVALVWALFWTARHESPAPGPSSPPQRASRIARSALIGTIIAAGILPIAGVLGWIDRYLTWGMYAGAPTLMAVWINPEMEARLPSRLQREVRSLTPSERGIIILDWSMRDLNVVYPELRVMRQAARHLAPFARQSSDARVVTVHEPDRWTGKWTREEQTIIDSPR